MVGAVVGAASALLWSSTPAVAGFPAELRLEYSFDTVNDGVVTDLTGRGHDLTLSGAWSVSEGVSSPAVAFAPVSLANTPHAKDLNPVGREFALTVSFRLPGDTSGVTDTPNMAQKGFWGDAAQFKMQLKPDIAAVQCRFKGTLGAKLLTSSVTGVDDGAWHTATCWKSAGKIGVTVDGTDTATTAAIGDIANTRPFRVGAKTLNSSTDQFVGDIDYVSLAMGDQAAVRSRAGVG